MVSVVDQSIMLTLYVVYTFNIWEGAFIKKRDSLLKSIL